MEEKIIESLASNKKLIKAIEKMINEQVIKMTPTDDEILGYLVQSTRTYNRQMAKQSIIPFLRGFYVAICHFTNKHITDDGWHNLLSEIRHRKNLDLLDF
jgi:hypothetical protein